MSIEFDPFGNDTQSVVAGPGEGMTLENGAESIVMYGDVEIEKTARSRERLDELIELLSRVRDSLPKA